MTRQDGPENETYQGHRSGPTSPDGPRFCRRFHSWLATDIPVVNESSNGFKNIAKLYIAIQYIECI